VSFLNQPASQGTPRERAAQRCPKSAKRTCFRQERLSAARGSAGSHLLPTPKTPPLGLYRLSIHRTQPRLSPTLRRAPTDLRKPPNGDPRQIARTALPQAGILRAPITARRIPAQPEVDGLVDFLVADDFVDFDLDFLFVDFLLLLCGVDFVGEAIGLDGVVGATAGAFAVGAGAPPDGACA
jgi:hypothetical protein